jgi:hypothetical protein
MDQLMEEKLVPRCSHDKPPGSKFCPTCGEDNNPMVERHPKEPLCTVKYRGEGGLGGVTKIAGLDFFKGTYDYSTEAASVIVVGIGIENSDDNEEKKLKIPDNFRGVIRQALEPHGLWDEKAYGLYAILHCSY